MGNKSSTRNHQFADIQKNTFSQLTLSSDISTTIQYTETEPAKIRSQQLSIQCQICGEQKDIKCNLLVNNQDYSIHFDLCHYGFIKNQNIVICLLCDHKSSSISTHRQHLNQLHSYISSYTKQMIIFEQNGAIFPTPQHLAIRQNVQFIQKLQIYMNGDGTAQIQCDNFIVSVYEKIYGLSQFNQSQAKAELIWANIFTRNRSAVYYNIQYMVDQKIVKVIGRIFQHE